MRRKRATEKSRISEYRFFHIDFAGGAGGTRRREWAMVWRAVVGSSMEYGEARIITKSVTTRVSVRSVFGRHSKCVFDAGKSVINLSEERFR